MKKQLVTGLVCLSSILCTTIASASLCTGSTATVWTTANPTPPEFIFENQTSYTGCSAPQSQTSISGVSFSSDTFTWTGEATNPNVFSLSGTATDVNNSGIAQGLLTNLVLSNSSWDIVNVTDNLSGWFVLGFDATSISLSQISNAAPVLSFGGVADFDFGSIDVQFVPVPAAAWLFGSALIGLVGIKRKS